MQSNTVRPIMKSVIFKDLVALTQDYKVAVVLHQLIYWTKRVHDFDRFLQEEHNRNPECNVDLRHGWIIKTAQDLADETMLGVSRQTMRTVLKNLVDLEVIEEAYLDDNKWDKTTKYRLNLVKLQESLFALGYPLSDFTLPQNPHNSRMLSSQHSNVKNGPSNVKKLANNIDKRLYTESIKDISLSPTSSSLGIAEEKNIANKMKEIWMEEIGSLEVSQLTPSLILSLYRSFQSLCGSCLTNWKSYCWKIASYKFLMGEASGKNFQKPWLTWAIKADTYQNIEAGQFTLGDRITFLLEAEKEELLRQEILSSSHHPLWKKVCLSLIEKISVFSVRQWLLEIDIASLTSQEVCLQVSNLFARGWITKNLKAQILSALEEALGHPIKHLQIDIPQNFGHPLLRPKLIEGEAPNNSPSISSTQLSFDAFEASNREEQDVPQISPLTNPSRLNPAGSLSGKRYTEYLNQPFMRACS